MYKKECEYKGTTSHLSPFVVCVYIRIPKKKKLLNPQYMFTQSWQLILKSDPEVFK